MDVSPPLKWYMVNKQGRSTEICQSQLGQPEWRSKEARIPCGIDARALDDSPPVLCPEVVPADGYLLHFLTTSTSLYLGRRLE